MPAPVGACSRGEGGACSGGGSGPGGVPGPGGHAWSGDCLL